MATESSSPVPYYPEALVATPGVSKTPSLDNVVVRVNERGKVFLETYTTSHEFQKSMAKALNDFMSFVRSLSTVSSTLSMQTHHYTPEEDKDGIMHMTLLASQFAQHTAESLTNSFHIFNSFVNFADDVAKKFAPTIRTANPRMDLSGDDAQQLLSFEQTEELSCRSVIESFVSFTNTIHENLKRFTQIKRTVDVHRNDALLALSQRVPNPNDRALKCLREECRVFDAKLKQVTDLKNAVAKLSISGKENEIIHSSAVKALSRMDNVPAVKDFVAKLGESKNAKDVSACIKSLVGGATAVDDLLTWPSFPDIIGIIERAAASEGAASASVAQRELRHGTLRMTEFEKQMLKIMKAQNKFREVLYKAKGNEKVSELTSLMREGTSLFEAPSVFIHNVMELLSDIRMSYVDNEVEFTDFSVPEESFKQFVVLYDRLSPLYEERRKLKKICIQNRLPENVAMLGRKYLFSCFLRFYVVMKQRFTVDAIEKGDCKKDGSLKSDFFEEDGFKVQMFVFSDLIVFKSNNAVKTWKMSTIREVHAGTRGREPCKTTFYIERRLSGKSNYYYFKVRGTKSMDVADMPTVVQRLRVAIKSYQKTSIFAKPLLITSTNVTLSCDGVPRVFLHALAWTLANDMDVKMPFRIPSAKEKMEKAMVMIENGFMPLYESHVPEALIKEMLHTIPGASLKYVPENWTVENEANVRFELAERINRLTSVVQRKLFAIMIAVAHCVIRHGAKTGFPNAESFSPLLGPNLFDYNLTHALQMKSVVPKLFERILDLTTTPAEFREMFWPLFYPDAKMPIDLSKQPTVTVTVKASVPRAAPSVSVVRHRVSNGQSLLRSLRHQKDLKLKLEQNPTVDEDEENDGSDDELSRIEVKDKQKQSSEKQGPSSDHSSDQEQN